MRNLVKHTLYVDVLDRGLHGGYLKSQAARTGRYMHQWPLYRGGIVFESDVQYMKTSLFKVQVAFSTITTIALRGTEILPSTNRGAFKLLSAATGRGKERISN